MGFGSSAPPPDPELEERRAAEKKRVEEERRKAEADKKERERVRSSNLYGQKSLQDEEMDTNQGYRTMGKSGSIRM